MHFAEGGYERVARKLLCDLDVDVFYVSGRIHLSPGQERLRTDASRRHSWSMITIAREAWSLCDTCL